MFKNLTPLVLPDASYLAQVIEAFGMPVDQMEAESVRHVVREPSNVELATVGFVPLPDQDGQAQVAHSFGQGANSVFLVYRQYKRDIPAQAVATELAKRVAKIEEREGRKTHAKERRQLREQILIEMIPRSFIKYTDTRVILTGNHVLIDTPSARRAEDVAGLFRAALGSFPVKRIETLTPVAVEMTRTLADRIQADSQLPAHSFPPEVGLAGEVEVRLDDIVYRAKDADLEEDAAVREMLADGHGTVHRLRLDFNNVAQATLDGDMVFRRIKLTDTEVLSWNETHESNETEENRYLAFQTDLFLTEQALTGMVDAVLTAVGVGKPSPGLQATTEAAAGRRSLEELVSTHGASTQVDASGRRYPAPPRKVPRVAPDPDPDDAAPGGDPDNPYDL